MDQKNLEVLQRLRDSLREQQQVEGTAPAPTRRPKPVQARTKPKTPWIEGERYQAGHQTEVQSVNPSKLDAPKAPAVWASRPCRFCKSVFVVNLKWTNPPVICPGCRTERKIPYKPGDGDTLYAAPQVFRGGSPGSGRRK